MPGWSEWAAAIAEALAGVCLAFPALRLSRHLLQLEKIQGAGTERPDELERLRGKYIRAMSRLLAKWDRRDHWLLRVGFAAFVFAAAIKLVGLSVSG